MIVAPRPGSVSLDARARFPVPALVPSRVFFDKLESLAGPPAGHSPIAQLVRAPH